MSNGELAGRGNEVDEVELARFRAYRDNPTNEQRNEIVVSYASLANALAQRFARRGEATEDIVQLRLRAHQRRRFDRSRVSSSASRSTIIGEIKRHFRDRTWGTQVVRSAKDLIPASMKRRRAIRRAAPRADAGRRSRLVGRSVDHVQKPRARRPTVRHVERHVRRRHYTSRPDRWQDHNSLSRSTR